MAKKRKPSGLSLAYQRVLATPEGRRVLWELMEFCGVYTESFTGNSQTFYNEGRRAVGLKVINDILDVDPGLYLSMIREFRPKGSFPEETDQTDDDEPEEDKSDE